MKSPDKLYRFHVTNLNTVNTAIRRVGLTLREAISKEEKETIHAFVRLYAFLLGAWIECRLKKLLFEQNGFDENERALVLANNTQLDQWKYTIDLGFRKHYSIPRAKLSTNNLSHSAFARYQTLLTLLNEELRPLVEVRNKLAHGQWAYPLNNQGDDIAQEQMNTLRTENILSLQFKKTLVSHLAAAIHDLVVSRPTFERDFDKHFRNIEETRRNLKKRNYATYAQQMRDKYLRGKRKTSSLP
jgi:hypothetical protein